jgi:hypothetical protein
VQRNQHSPSRGREANGELLRLGMNGEGFGAVSTPTCESSTRPSRIHNALLALSVCIFAFAVFLVSPALALADSSNGNGNASTTSTPSDPAAPTSGSVDSTTTTSAPATSPAESAPVTPDASPETNTSAADTAGAQGNGNGNGNVAAPAVTPTPDAAPPVTTPANAQNNGNSNNSPNGNASGQTSSPGNSANAPGNGDSPGNSDHAGNASASANANQDKPKNVNVDVRVGNPGDNGAVVQGNGAAAAAGAGSAGGSGSGSGSAPTALAPGGAATDANATPGGAAPAPSQADSTSGETIPNANSPPGGTTGSESCANGLGSTATTPSPDGQSPTDSNTSPSASYVNGQCGDTQTGGNSGTSTAGNTDSDPQATGVTVEIDPGTDDGSGGTTVVDTNPDDTATDASPMPTVTITAPTPTSSSSQDSATATATSTQVDPANINTTVRVLSPGENGPIHQTNISTATAAAGATGPATGTQVATPTATSTQVTPVNVNVSIRVGSPGNDAPVTQGNTSTAVAAPVDPALIDAAVTDLPANGPNSSGDVENASSVIQDLAECSADETDCISSSSGSPQGITGPGGSAADNSIASATQDSPSNVNVSIRVASPGADGLLTQLNDASATGLTSVETVTNPDNLGVAIVVPGFPQDVVIPTGSDTPWNWNWNWTTGSAPTDPGATPTSTADWTWNWTAPAEGSPAATSAPQGTPGLWTWTWTWTRGEWSVSWTYQQACDCSWTWNWTWVWPADSPSAPTSPASALLPPPPANPQISQTNDSTAAAAAVTTFDGSQEMTISSDGESDATQYQGITSIQSATASADAGQVDPRNTIIRTAGAIEGIKQQNRVASASTAAAFDTATQTLEQTQTGTDDGAVHSVASTQVIGTLQTATSDAVAAQAHALNLAHLWSQASGNQAWIQKITQTNESVALGFAAVESVTSQSLSQTQTGAGSDQLADALQEAVTTQQNVASAHVGQASVRNRIEMEIPWNGALNPPIDQSNGVSAASISESYSEITQTAMQEASGEGVEWDQHAQQVAIVNQGGTASSSASQSNIDNLAHWTGTLATPPSATFAGGGGSSFGQAGDAPLADSLIFGAPPRRLSGVLAGSVELSRLSAARILTAPYGSRGFDSVGAAPGPRAAATASAPMTPSERFVHTLFNLLGASSSALVLLLGTTPFAALLGLFMIAALVVGRLQYAMPALGRSVDFARRERPG